MSVPLPLILDTDIGTDVDDALALAFAIRHPEINLKAVTTVSGNAHRRAQIARKLLCIAGRAEVPVAVGIGGKAPRATREPWRGDEGEELLEPAEEPSISSQDGVSVLLDLSVGAEDESGCDVAAVGMLTNVAAALARDASFSDRIGRLAVMGGIFGPVRDRGRTVPPAEADHNLNCDPDAALVVLNAGIPLLYVPGNVTSQAEFGVDDVERLRGGDELCQALARLLDIHVSRANEQAEGRAALLHDPLTVACMIDRRFVSVARLPVTAALLGPHVRTFVDPLEGRLADVVTALDAPAFREFWLETVLDERR
jgi:purine nucleosidase